jgi:hypothetical protein
MHWAPFNIRILHVDVSFRPIFSRNLVRAAITTLSFIIMGCGSSAGDVANRHLSQCSLGTQRVEERQLLAPHPRTFYSVDVLNPDVVAYRGRYFMYFSGNDRHIAKGDWRTGIAVATSPTGPFRVQGNLRANYLNGGTTVWQGLLWHLVEDKPVEGPDIRSELAWSSDGIHWHHRTYLPGFTTDGVTYRGADFFLEPKGSQLGVYMLAVPPGGGIGRSLAFASYADEHWSDFHILVDIRAVAALNWASADLGEPATFYVGKKHYLLFVGLARNDLTRSIGLMSELKTGWDLCSDSPATPNSAPWGPASSIDPSPLTVGKRLYIYYGATRTAGFPSNLGGSVVVRSFNEP